MILQRVGVSLAVVIALVSIVLAGATVSPIVFLSALLA